MYDTSYDPIEKQIERAKRVLVIDNPRERVDMVLNNQGEYTLCLVGEDEGHSKPIKFCPFCGKKLV